MFQDINFSAASKRHLFDTEGERTNTGCCFTLCGEIFNPAWQSGLKIGTEAGGARCRRCEKIFQASGCKQRLNEPEPSLFDAPSSRSFLTLVPLPEEKATST